MVISLFIILPFDRTIILVRIEPNDTGTYKSEDGGDDEAVQGRPFMLSCCRFMPNMEVARLSETYMNAKTEKILTSLSSSM